MITLTVIRKEIEQYLDNEDSPVDMDKYQNWLRGWFSHDLTQSASDLLEEEINEVNVVWE